MERFASRVLPWVYSLLTHLALLAIFTTSFSFGRAEPLPPAGVAIKARVVDEARIAQEVERLDAQERDRQRELEEQRLRLAREADKARATREEEERRLAAVEQQRKDAEETARREQIAEREATAARIEQEKTRLADIERKRKEEEARLAQAAREREALERRKRDEEIRLAAVAKERADEAQRQREAAEARDRARLESELAVAIQAEEHRRGAENSGLLAQYKTLIQQKVERNWARPPSAGAGLDCEVRVRQIPGGEVVDVRIGQCNGDAAVMRSIEAAVYKASPLPPPPDPALFERDLLFEFRPK